MSKGPLTYPFQCLPFSATCPILIVCSTDSSHEGEDSTWARRKTRFTFRTTGASNEGRQAKMCRACNKQNTTWISSFYRRTDFLLCSRQTTMVYFKGGAILVFKSIWHMYDIYRYLARFSISISILWLYCHSMHTFQRHPLTTPVLLVVRWDKHGRAWGSPQYLEPV